MARGTKLFLAVLALSTACYAIAEVYRVFNMDGTITYTDTPPAGDPTVEQVTLPTTNTAAAVQTPTMTKKGGSDNEFTGYHQITIISPVSGTTIPPGHEEILIQVSIMPNLQPDHLIQLIFNGQPYGAPSSSTSFTIGSLIRGEHSLQVQVLDSNNDIVGQSGTTTVYVKRHSIGHNKKQPRK